MYLLLIGWLYVVLMMAVVEAVSPQGTVLGAVITLLLYGALPLSIVLYVMGTPARRARRRAAESDRLAREEPDRGSHAPGDAVTPEREEA